MRGTVYKPELRRISESAEESFGFLETTVVTFEDLYAGKILAALDRQHPSNLFDIKYLLDNEGVTSSLKEAFIVYLISHTRRFLEILSPSFLDIAQIFKTDFQGMTIESIKISDLEDIRKALVKKVNGALNDRDKQFLIGFKEGTLDWSYFSVPHIKDLPAVKWKQHNLNQIPSAKRKSMVDDLKDYFGM